MSKLPHYLARAELQRSEWKIMRAVERLLASSEWCDWRDELRRLVAMEDGFDALPPEPPFGRAQQQLESPPYIDRSERPPDVVGGLEELRAKIDRVRKTGSIDPSGVDDLEPLKPDDLIDMVADNPPGSAAELENAVRGIRGDARRRLTELLNVELSGLEQERAVGSSHANPKREQQIEYLLGLFARLGEI